MFDLLERDISSASQKNSLSPLVKLQKQKQKQKHKHILQVLSWFAKYFKL